LPQEKLHTRHFYPYCGSFKNKLIIAPIFT
jgi:hypothetical protein